MWIFLNGLKYRQTQKKMLEINTFVCDNGFIFVENIFTGKKWSNRNPFSCVLKAAPYYIAETANGSDNKPLLIFYWFCFDLLTNNNNTNDPKIRQQSWFMAAAQKITYIRLDNINSSNNSTETTKTPTTTTTITTTTITTTTTTAQKQRQQHNINNNSTTTKT